VLKSERLIVSEVLHNPRRDECRSDIIGRDGKKYPFRRLDTAGSRRRQIASPVEFFARLRSLDAIRNTDVVSSCWTRSKASPSRTKLRREAIRRKTIVIVVNKWDLVQRLQSKWFPPYKSDATIARSMNIAVRAIFFTPGSTSFCVRRKRVRNRRMPFRG